MAPAEAFWASNARQGPPPRRPWVIKKDRWWRSIPELEDILAEQLTKLRESDRIY